jgi:hypothetical protein
MLKQMWQFGVRNVINHMKPLLVLLIKTVLLANRGTPVDAVILVGVRLVAVVDDEWGYLMVSCVIFREIVIMNACQS